MAPRTLRVLKSSSRMGAYGLTVAAYSLVGFPLPPGSEAWAIGLSLLFGGIGTLVASIIITLRLQGSLRILELAAVLGLGLGGSAAVLSVFPLLGGVPGAEKLAVIAYMAIPFLGLAVVLLFVVGIVKRMLVSDESETGST